MRLSKPMRDAAEVAVSFLVKRRPWASHAFDARTNHCHWVVSASGYEPSLVRDQVKAEITKQLRKQSLVAEDGPVWSEGGWIEYLDDEDAIHQTSIYVLEAQDRKGRDQQDQMPRSVETDQRPDQ